MRIVGCNGHKPAAVAYAVVRRCDDERVGPYLRLEGPGLDGGAAARPGFDEARERLEDIAALMSFAYAQGVRAERESLKRRGVIASG